MAFSHTHLVGAGVNDLGHFGVTPFRKTARNFEVYENGPWETIDRKRNSTNRLWWSKFEKSSEYAHPGIYGVTLDDPNVEVELLAISTMAGIHSYTWKDLSATDFAALVIDFCHTSKINAGILNDRPCRDATVTVAEDKLSFSAAVQIQGSLSGLLWTYLHAEIVLPTNSKRHLTWRTCTDIHLGSSCVSSSELSVIHSTSGTLISFVEFATIGMMEKEDSSADGRTNRIMENGDSSADGRPNSDFTVELHTAISFISEELALQNLLEARSGNADMKYSLFVDRTSSVWCEALSALTLSPNPGDEDISRMLFSAFYHTLMSPTSYSESGGYYIGLDKRTHNSFTEREALYGAPQPNLESSYHFYSDLSLWDTFRSQHPWVLLTDEVRAVGIARSVADMSTQQGSFPR